MPKKVTISSYRLHKGSGQAVIVLNGRSRYLGKWNTPESHVEYQRVLAEWLASGQSADTQSAEISSGAAVATNDLRVSELILAFFEHAKKHYRHPDGTPTREVDNYRDALRPLRKLYGDTRARDFGPLRLRAVREAMLKEDLCRSTINARVQRIRRAFRWAASMELIPGSVVQDLNTVASLQRGRCEARESKGVRPVDWTHVDAVLPHLPRAVAAMVELMRYCNCRAEDVVIMRPCHLAIHGDVWEYRPPSHKNQWREEGAPQHKRIVHLGPRCQEVLRPFLDRPATAYLFNPRESRAAYHLARAAARKTKKTPSELNRKRKSMPRRAPKERYTVNTFQQTVRKTCKRLGVPVWTILQVRHSRATEIRQRYGLEGAAASLGDTLEAAQIYAENNRLLAKRIACEVG